MFCNHKKNIYLCPAFVPFRAQAAEYFFIN